MSGHTNSVGGRTGWPVGTRCIVLLVLSSLRVTAPALRLDGAMPTCSTSSASAHTCCWCACRPSPRVAGDWFEEPSGIAEDGDGAAGGSDSCGVTRSPGLPLVPPPPLVLARTLLNQLGMRGRSCSSMLSNAAGPDLSCCSPLFHSESRWPFERSVYE